MDGRTVNLQQSGPPGSDDISLRHEGSRRNGRHRLPEFPMSAAPPPFLPWRQGRITVTYEPKRRVAQEHVGLARSARRGAQEPVGARNRRAGCLLFPWNPGCCSMLHACCVCLVTRKRQRAQRLRQSCCNVAVIRGHAHRTGSDPEEWIPRSRAAHASPSPQTLMRQTTSRSDPSRRCVIAGCCAGVAFV